MESGKGGRWLVLRFGLVLAFVFLDEVIFRRSRQSGERNGGRIRVGVFARKLWQPGGKGGGVHPWQQLTATTVYVVFYKRQAALFVRPVNNPFQGGLLLYNYKRTDPALQV